MVVEPSGKVSTFSFRSTLICAFGSAFCAATSFAYTSGLTTTGSKPFFNELPLKMSANEVEMTTRSPQPTSAHGACSREEPQPKLSPASKTCAPCDAG